MVSDLFFYQLVLVVPVWLCVMLSLGVAQRPHRRVSDDTGAPMPTAQAPP
jgi:hypothetical protein